MPSAQESTMPKRYPSGPPDRIPAPSPAPPAHLIQEDRPMSAKSLNLFARSALVSAAFIASSALVLGVGALFDSASREPWLADTALVRHALAACPAEVENARRLTCVRRFVAEARQRERQYAQLTEAR
jgi:hypothetical protein